MTHARQESPEFLLYLSELGALAPERIVSEPERVSEELAGVQAYTQELAFSNYKTFIQTSSCSREIVSAFSETETQLSQLLEKLPQFAAQCSQFQVSRGAESSSLLFFLVPYILWVCQLG